MRNTQNSAEITSLQRISQEHIAFRLPQASSDFLNSQPASTPRKMSKYDYKHLGRRNLTMSDNYQNLSSPIDICSPFVYYAFKVLAGSGSGEPSLTGVENKPVSD